MVVHEVVFDTVCATGLQTAMNSMNGRLSSPRCTSVVPVPNRGDLLRGVLDGLAKQSRPSPSFVVLVCDHMLYGERRCSVTENVRQHLA